MSGKKGMDGRKHIDLSSVHDEIVRMYVEEKIPARLIAKKLNDIGFIVSMSTIVRHLKKTNFFKFKSKVDLSLHHDEIMQWYFTDVINLDEIALRLAAPGDKRTLKGKLVIYLKKIGMLRTKEEATNHPVIKAKIIESKLLMAASRDAIHCNFCQSPFKPFDSQQKFCMICAPKHIDVARIKAYKINRPQFDTLLLAQKNRCQLCEVLFNEIQPEKGRQTMCIDHCHKTGVVRGILCGNCNRTLGIFEKHQGKWIENAQRYLEKDHAIPMFVNEYQNDLLISKVRLYA